MSNKIRLGVSLYPEQESIEEIESYLKMASERGFTKVFTSLFSVPGTKEEIMNYFKTFTAIAHKYGFEVDGDVNFAFFKMMGAKPDDLSVFKEMGVDVIRMDGPYKDERDAQVVNNAQGLKIEFNTCMKDIIDNAIAHGANPENIVTCHNFYPQRYTCPALEDVKAENIELKDYPVAMFMSSQVKGTHGPWPVSDGLPTIEEHRNIPLESQLKHMVAMKTVDEALIGNAFASEEELDAVKATFDKIYFYNAPFDEKDATGDAMTDAVMQMLPSGDLVRIPLRMNMEEGVSDLEKEMMFSLPFHGVSGDSLNYTLRSRFPRFVCNHRTVEVRPVEKPFFEKGDVVVVNDNCRHYAGEVQIVMKPMENDGQRNLVGHIVPEEMLILDELKGNDLFTLEAAE
ncbi:MAG: MupG family TIM beta-alpha barrel fold protein [Allobaculum sp.]